MKKKSLLATYVKIFIVIALMIAAIYALIRFVDNGYSNEMYETIKTNMLLIQGKTEVIAQKVEIKEKGAELIGTKIKDKQEEEPIKKLIEAGIINIESKDNNYYCLSNEDLKKLGLENITTNNYYIVDYKKNDIIYVDGIQNQSGNIVYKLSEM